MCYALYLFTDEFIAKTEWTEENPAMWIQAVSEGADLDALKWPHNKKNIYYIGSYSRCGCGWSSVTQWDAPEDISRKQSGRHNLAEILNSLNDRKFWLVICWEGNQGGPLLEAAPIRIEDILNDSFEFEEMRKYICENR